MDLNDVMAVVNNNRAAALCLSKGGWEGWLQCELWSYLSIEKNPSESVEREVRYPNENIYCDLVVNDNRWVELKAFGIFREGDANRFMEGIAGDLHKMNKKPNGTDGLVLAIVPKAIGTQVRDEFQNRGWTGFSKLDGDYVSIFYRSC